MANRKNQVVVITGTDIMVDGGVFSQIMKAQTQQPNAAADAKAGNEPKPKK